MREKQLMSLLAVRFDRYKWKPLVWKVLFKASLVTCFLLFFTSLRLDDCKHCRFCLSKFSSSIPGLVESSQRMRSLLGCPC
ncbi:hypothetical protein R1flu_021298 [Riccia fluitans]|uniref:Uncharacterized protein n=1 Tax=Riccia fluitans TaxID=41844 RepID=A0ABD1ZPA7_9MARC